MAIYEKVDLNGIQLGNDSDYCWRCNKPYQPIEHYLENEEVFKLKINGLDYCLCMDHFQAMLGDYVLVHKDTLTEDEVLEIPKDLVENGTHEEVLAYIEKATK